jgi:hypothetical protein
MINHRVQFGLPQMLGTVVIHLFALRGSEPVAALDAERPGVKITQVGVEVLEVDE